MSGSSGSGRQFRASTVDGAGADGEAPAMGQRSTQYFTNVATDVGVPQKIYLNWVKDQLENESACLELPVTIILLLAFSLLAIMHLTQNVAFAVEQGIERDVIDNANFAFAHHFGHKDIFDVHSVGDFWSWLRIGFLPLVIQPSWSYSEEYNAGAASAAALAGIAVVTPPKESWMFGAFQPSQTKAVPVTGDYLRYNRLIGGLRFRQQVAPQSDDFCVWPSTLPRETWAKWYGKPCMPATQELAFTPTTVDVESFPDPQRVEWFYSELDNFETFIAKAVDMEDGCQQLPAKQRSECLCEWCSAQDPPRAWFDESTQRLEIAFASYNPNYGLMTLSTVSFFMNRGGLISKHVEIKSSWVDPFSRPFLQVIGMLVCDVTWLGLLFYIFVKEVQEVFNTIRSDCGHWYMALWDDYIGFWNVVDWISFFVAVVVVVLFLNLQFATTAMKEELNVLIQTEQNPADIVRADYAVMVDNFYDALEEVIDREKTFRLSLCIYPMMVMMRLFKSFAAQPRLAVVTETLTEGFSDMAHFFLVFLSVLSCMCLDSVLIFGQDLLDFATFPRALHTCFRMMFGEWDWAPMEQIRRSHAGAWFILFMLIIVVILFNIVLAIVMKYYMQVKHNTENAVTLNAQINEMKRRYWQSRRKERVRLNDVLKAFQLEAKELGMTYKEMFQSERKITSDFLMDMVDGMKHTQAKRTLKNSWDAATASTVQISLQDSQQLLHNLEASTKVARDDLFFIYERAQFYDTIGKTNGDDAGEANAMNQANERLEDPPEGLVNDETLEFLNSEVGRLSSEMASVLAQTMRRVDKRQSHIELRQDDMLSAVHDIQGTLQKLQSDASNVAMRMQRTAHHKNKATAAEASSWRNLPRSLGPSCMEFTIGTNADTQPIPALPSASASVPRG